MSTLDQKIRQLYANIGKVITSSLDIDKIQQSIMDEICVFFKPEHWSLMRKDAASGDLFFVVASGIDFETVKNVRLKSGEGIAGKVAQSGEAMFIENAENDERVSQKVDDKTGFKTRSILAVPMKFQGEVYGVIELINRDVSDFFSSEEFMILKTIADFSAIAFAHAQLYQRTNLLAFTDPLTGVYNRNFLRKEMEKWAKEGAQNRRQNEESDYITMIVVDLNNFKNINDSEGHQAGDRVLKEVAKALLTVVRENDKVVRIGGDEFLLLLRNPTAEQAQQAEERLNQALTKLLETTHQNINFSYGIASGRPEEAQEIFHEADLSMYKRKKESKAL